MTAPDVERRILEARARRLAQRPIERKSTIDDRDVVVFSHARADYGLELSCLRQVFPLRELALLPGAAPPLMGVTAWRGDLIRVLDLARILELPDTGPSDRGRVLVLDGGPGSFALLADSIVDVVRLPDSSLTARSDRRFLRGVTADAVAVLDGAALIRTFTGEVP
jgi:purine-binding chemotaxis protein CheW